MPPFSDSHSCEKLPVPPGADPGGGEPIGLTPPNCECLQKKNPDRKKNQILTFQIFKCHYITKCLSMNHEMHFTESL